MHDVQVRNTVQQHSIESTLLSAEPESERSYRPIDIKGSHTSRAVLDWATLIMEQFRSRTEKHANKIVNPLHCSNFDIETIQKTLKSVKSCSKLVRENSNDLLENKAFLKNKVRTEERDSVCKSILYRKEVLEAVKRQIQMCPKEESI